MTRINPVILVALLFGACIPPLLTGKGVAQAQNVNLSQNVSVSTQELATFWMVMHSVRPLPDNTCESMLVGEKDDANCVIMTSHMSDPSHTSLEDCITFAKNEAPQLHALYQLPEVKPYGVKATFGCESSEFAALRSMRAFLNYNK